MVSGGNPGRGSVVATTCRSCPSPIATSMTTPTPSGALSVPQVLNGEPGASSSPSRGRSTHRTVLILPRSRRLTVAPAPHRRLRSIRSGSRFWSHGTWSAASFAAPRRWTACTIPTRPRRSRAVNHWQIAKWLEPEPRLRASLVVPQRSPYLAETLRGLRRRRHVVWVRSLRKDPGSGEPHLAELPRAGRARRPRAFMPPSMGKIHRSRTPTHPPRGTARSRRCRRGGRSG